MNVNDFGPFSSGVWGTVSEWLIACLTTTTAIFLHKTFKSQKLAFAFEKRKYKAVIMPYFKHEILDLKSPKRSWKKASYSFMLKISLKNEQRAINVVGKFITDDPQWISNVNGFGTMATFEIHNNVCYQIKYSNPNHILTDKNKNGFFLKMTFNDVEGNRYEQDFRNWELDGEFKVLSYPPKEL